VYDARDNHQQLPNESLNSNSLGALCLAHGEHAIHAGFST
jgi:hypothetical protein